MSAMPETTRYERATSLSPVTHPLSLLVEVLGDASWRVRKAALDVLPRFATQPGLVLALIDGLASEDNAGLRNACSEALVRLGPIAVPELGSALRTADQDLRKFVVEVLGALGTPEARDVLLSALDDADVNVRAAVAEALGRIGGDAIVARLLGKLAACGGDVQQAVYLLDALAAARARVALPELHAFMGKAPIARSLFPVLGWSGDERAYGPLIDGTLSGSAGTRNAAIVALATLLKSRGDGARLAVALRERPKAIERIERALETQEDAVVIAAIRVLRTLVDPSMAPRFLAAAESHPVVEEAMDAVMDFGVRAAAPLLEAIDRVGIEARVLFLEALENVGEPSIVPDLLDLSAGLETRTSEAALRALGSLAEPRHLDALMRLARRDEAELALQAAHAIAAMSRRHPDETARRVREAIAEGDLRPVWMVVLGAIGRDEDIQIVQVACRHTDPEVRRAALEAAPIFGARFPFDTLMFALADEQPSVRQAAARGLSCYREPEVGRALVAATRDKDPWVVAEALRALGAVGGERATETLLAAVQSLQSPIAIAALQSLFLLNPNGIEAAVRRALTHVDPEVVREAIDVSIRLPAVTARDILVAALAHRSWTVRRAAAESLANRGIGVAIELIEERLAQEAEPLVREELERLSAPALGEGV